MVANPKFNAALAHVDDAAIQPLPHSRKIYARGSRADIRVPMREIAQADTPASFGAEKNPPIFVYDTSGPYTDPEVADRHPPGPRALAREVDRRARRHRGARRADLALRPRTARRPEARRDALRPQAQAAPSRRPGSAVTQMHYARRGIVTPEMEYIAIRENVRRKEYLESACAPPARPARRWPS